MNGREKAPPAPAETAPGGGYLPTLDGWRALAVGAVIVCHCANGAGLPPRWDALGTLLGAEGVSVFFALSGLLITYRLLRERRARGGIVLKRFYARRAFRILPAALAYLATVAVLAAAGWQRVSASAFAAAALFYRNYRGAPGWAVAHFWSLAVEEHFYLLWPGLLAWRGARRAAMAAMAGSVAVFFWRWGDGVHHWTAHLLPSAAFSQRTDIRLDALLWGCLVALALDSNLRPRFVKYLSPLVWWGVAALFLAAAIRNLGPASLSASVQAICLPLLLAGTLLHPRWIGSRALEWPALRWLGRLSYSLYLWQELFLGLGRTHWLELRLAAVLACAAGSYYLVERPALGWAHRRFGARDSARAATA